MAQTDQLVRKIIESHPKCAAFALSIQADLDRGVPRHEVISKARKAVSLERYRLQSLKGQ